MRTRLCLLVPLLLALAGCTITMHQWPTGPDEGEVPFARLLTVGTIFAPLLNGGPFGYNAYVQPGSLVNMDFSGGRDQYGGPWGLSDPVRFIVDFVSVRCAEKMEDDTIFWPSAEFPVPHYDNSCVWFPGWTAPIETISGLPYPFYPLSGYPWNACLDKHDVETMEAEIASLVKNKNIQPLSLLETQRLAILRYFVAFIKSLPDMPSQQATITVTAKAESIHVEFVCPVMAAPGAYVVDRPGATPTQKDRDPDTPEFEVGYHTSEPGTYTVTWTFIEPNDWEGDALGDETWEFEIPVDWFWIEGQWTIDVGPTGTC